VRDPQRLTRGLEADGAAQAAAGERLRRLIHQGSSGLQENPGLPAEHHAKMLGLIVEETKRLNRLIGQCLDLVAEAGVANDRYSERDRRGAA
jgi:hypothetical protein